MLISAGCEAPSTDSAMAPSSGGSAQTPSRAKKGSVEDLAPEAATGRRAVLPGFARKHMAVAAHPLAAEAGFEMLEKGGSAIDAAIAMAITLTLVEPQSSGLGGGGFLLHYTPGAEGGAGQIEAYDGRETAPAGATPELFHLDGKPLNFFTAVASGRSVGVPGLLRMLEQAHKAHGKLPWADLFQPAIRSATEGFEITPRLHSLLLHDTHGKFGPPGKERGLKEKVKLRSQQAARAYFFDAEGEPLPVGHRLKNPALAETLKAIASGGADAFYTGPIAADIARAVQEARFDGPMTAEDLANYQPKVRKPVCLPYRRWQICGFPPPTSGGVTLLQILGMLSHFEISQYPPDSPETLHLFGEAARLAYADRGRYLADPDFVPVPAEGLLDAEYLKQRAALIHPAQRAEQVTAGTPPGAKGAQHQADDNALELPSTSHMVAVDAEGRAISMTASIEYAFGSRIFVRGFLLNNELTDFSFQPESNGQPVANRVQPGKRPRSSMAPIMVLDQAGRFHAAIGSPGGSRIILYVARALMLMLDYGLDVQRAIELPHVLTRGGAVEIEPLSLQRGWPGELEAALKEKGHPTQVGELNSGLHGLQRTSFGYIGGADPRREGRVMGR